MKRARLENLIVPMCDGNRLKPRTLISEGSDSSRKNSAACKTLSPSDGLTHVEAQLAAEKEKENAEDPHHLGRHRVIDCCQVGPNELNLIVEEDCGKNNANKSDTAAV